MHVLRRNQGITHEGGRWLALLLLAAALVFGAGVARAHGPWAVGAGTPPYVSHSSALIGTADGTILTVDEAAPVAPAPAAPAPAPAFALIGGSILGLGILGLSLMGIYTRLSRRLR
jgi:hypothetical protein